MTSLKQSHSRSTNSDVKLGTLSPQSTSRRQRVVVCALAALSLAACADIDATADETQSSDSEVDLAEQQAALAEDKAAAAGLEKGRTRYIVVLREHVANPAAEAGNAARGHAGRVEFTYTRALKGFAVSLPDAAGAAFVKAMSHNPNVERIEADQLVTASALTTQSGATWGLDRIDQRALPLNASYSYPRRGAGVTAYVVDTGILASHADFAGRVRSGYSAINDGRGTADCNGHGTHVAGTIGGTTDGAAKSAALVPVRVLSCSGSGTLSGMVAGLDWVLANAKRPAVVNMSLGGGASSTVDAAVARVVAGGIPVVVAAGNENVDACTKSPARAASAITVGATTSTDARASYSNYGTCLDVFAPGSAIRSAWYTSSTAIATLSGTSMASPHVAGLVAMMLEGTPTATPAQLDERLKGSATLSKVTSAGTGSPNRLVHTSAAPL